MEEEKGSDHQLARLCDHHTQTLTLREKVKERRVLQNRTKVSMSSAAVESECPKTTVATATMCKLHLTLECTHAVSFYDYCSCSTA